MRFFTAPNRCEEYPVFEGVESFPTFQSLRKPDRIYVKLSRRQRTRLLRGDLIFERRDDVTSLLEENATSMCMILHLTRDAPYKILTFTDSKYWFHNPLDGFLRGDRQTWEHHRIAPCGRCTGVSQFLALSIQTIMHWEQAWTETLDSVESYTSLDVCP
jgi:hypothetical protein